MTKQTIPLNPTQYALLMQANTRIQIAAEQQRLIIQSFLATHEVTHAQVTAITADGIEIEITDNIEGNPALSQDGNPPQ